ncbi:uncharacterized protein RCC_06233 [Ramularia collo-cygni]|uniref:Uncharacterized protein n=1 Tax=Ramularia collo-cygni TaxID=112498 RepID=A0A2D3VHY2_9PEZI|nr:uncharacterized protein RCC_06233 [Ramularia collo-cygni]CZT20373.1 uncharacterized protein RCC_06233 [Ramularia collo-cygni]
MVQSPFKILRGQILVISDISTLLPWLASQTITPALQTIWIVPRKACWAGYTGKEPYPPTFTHFSWDIPTLSSSTTNVWRSFESHCSDSWRDHLRDQLRDPPRDPRTEFQDRRYDADRREALEVKCYIKTALERFFDLQEIACLGRGTKMTRRLRQDITPAEFPGIGVLDFALEVYQFGRGNNSCRDALFMLQKEGPWGLPSSSSAGPPQASCSRWKDMKRDMRPKMRRSRDVAISWIPLLNCEYRSGCPTAVLGGTQHSPSSDRIRNPTLPADVQTSIL